MYWVSLIIVGLIFSWPVWNWLAKEQEVPGGWISVVVASLLGAWLGDLILRDWGWVVSNYNVIAGIIGSLVVAGAWTLVTKKGNEKASVSQ